MELTGAAKEAFIIWYEDKHMYEQTFIHHEWFEIPDSMKFGVCVDWFDSVGIYIELCKVPTDRKFYCMINDDSGEPIMYNTRHEARTEAIKKANELFNNK